MVNNNIFIISAAKSMPKSHGFRLSKYSPNTSRISVFNVRKSSHTRHTAAAVKCYWS